jgi:hypothetical protein
MFREIPLYIVVMFLEIYQLCIYICPLSHVQRDFSIYCSNVSKDLQALYLHFACVITATFLKEKRYIILTKWPFQVVLSWSILFYYHGDILSIQTKNTFSIYSHDYVVKKKNIFTYVLSMHSLVLMIRTKVLSFIPTWKMAQCNAINFSVTSGRSVLLSLEVFQFQLS